MLASVLTPGCSQPETKTNAVAPVPVKVQALKAGQVEESSNFVGSLEAAEKVEIKPEIQGRIEAINVREGQPVAQGTVLMSLKPDQTLPQLQSAEAALNAAIAARDTATKQLQIAQAQLATAQPDFQLAQANHDRVQFLAGQGAIGKFQADQATNQVADAQSRVASAQDQVSAARAAISQAEASIQQARVKVQEAQLSVAFKQVVAPIAGVVGTLPVKTGDYVTTGETMAIVTQNNPLDLRISVPSNWTGQLRPGLPVKLTDPVAKHRLVTGQVHYISPSVDATNQSILIKARFPNSSSLLRDGQYVEARLIWKKTPGVLIPATSISRIGGQAFVFVVEAESTENGETQQVVSQRQVKLGDIQGQSYPVLEGLEPGETIATSNILQLKDGTPVQPES